MACGVRVGKCSWHAATFNVSYLGEVELDGSVNWCKKFLLKRHKDGLNDYRKGWNVTAIYSMVVVVDRKIVRHSIIVYTRQS